MYGNMTTSMYSETRVHSNTTWVVEKQFRFIENVLYTNLTNVQIQIKIVVWYI